LQREKANQFILEDVKYINLKMLKLLEEDEFNLLTSTKKLLAQVSTIVEKSKSNAKMRMMAN